jgi:hypothetical protein
VTLAPLISSWTLHVAETLTRSWNTNTRILQDGVKPAICFRLNGRRPCANIVQIGEEEATVALQITAQEQKTRR